MDDRSEFVRQWFKRAQKSTDDFDRYICLYLCLVVLAKSWATQNGINPCNDDDPEDGWFVNAYFFHHENAHILVEVAESVKSFLPLVTQKNDEGDHIAYCCRATDREKLKALYMHYKANSMIPDSLRAGAIGVMLKNIRNNLFHGRKYYERERDQMLVSSAAPILHSLVIDGAKRQLDLACDIEAISCLDDVDN